MALPSMGARVGGRMERSFSAVEEGKLEFGAEYTRDCGSIGSWRRLVACLWFSSETLLLVMVEGAGEEGV